MNVLISKTSNQPIYEQIKDQIRKAILHGDLNNEELLPSIRELAKNLQVSVITTKRAYEDLEKEGYVTSIVGKGTYVSDLNPEFLKEKQLFQIESHLQEAVKDSKLINMPLEELQLLIEELYKGEN